MPEQIIEKIKKSILPEWKVCFFASLIIGLFAHLYKITNWIPNWDSLVFRYDNQNMLAMGRWFLPVACGISSFYDLPMLAGMMAIIFHALGAVCICKLLDIKKKMTAGLLGAVVAAFPTVTSVMMYNYVADGYALAFLLSCIAALLFTKEKPCYIGAILLITLSTGIYQAYITVTIALILLHMIMELIYKDTDIKGWIIKAIKMLVAGVLGMGLYYLVMTVLLKITGTELLDYQGFDSAASLESIDIRASLYWIKENFITYFFDFSKGVSVFTLLNCIIFVVTPILYLIDIIRRRLPVARIILTLCCVAFLPVGASALCMINGSLDYHNLMKMGYVVFYLLLVVQYDGADFECAKANLGKLWTIFGICTVLIFNYIVIANVGYHKLNMAYEKSMGTLNRIADRLEQTEGSRDIDKLLVLGRLAGSDAYSVNLPPDITGATDAYILRADDEMIEQSVLCSALEDYCGLSYDFVHGEERKEILEMIDADNMNCWPAKDSVSVVGDVIVIKLGE